MNTQEREQFENQAAHFCLKHNLRTINCTPRTAELIEMLKSAFQAGRLAGLREAAEIAEKICFCQNHAYDCATGKRTHFLAAAIREQIAEQGGEAEQ